MVLNDCKKRHTKLEMAWIDYKKAYDMTAHSWIFRILKLVQASENIVQFIRKTLKKRNAKLSLCGDYLAKVDMTRDIFKRDSLSPLLFVIFMILLIQILPKIESVYVEK